MPKTAPSRFSPPRPEQRGMTLIELMIALTVLVVGLLGTLTIMTIAVAANGRNRLDSSSSTMVQMVSEKITSIPANTTGTPALLTITDCNPAGSPTADHSVNTAGTSSGAGAPLDSNGNVDFTQATVDGYSMTYYACGTSGRQVLYDVRWNIQTKTRYAKLITVSARMSGAGSDLKYFATPVTVRTIMGK